MWKIGSLFFVLGCAVSLSVGCLFAQEVAEQELVGPVSFDADYVPEPEELYMAYIRQNGGLENIEGLNSIIISGEFETTEKKGLSFTMYRKRPNKLRFLFDYGFVRVEQIFDGRQAWQVIESDKSDEPVVEQLKGDELKSLVAGSRLEGPFFTVAQRLSRIEQITLDEVNGMPAYRVDIADNPEVAYDSIWIRQDDFTEIKYLSLEPGAEGAPAVKKEVYLSDFRKARGIDVPAVMEYYTDGEFDKRIVVKRVRTNAGVFDSYFVDPRK